VTTVEPIGLGEAAERLGVHYMTAYRYIRTGRLSAVKVDAQWRVDPGEVARLMAGPLEPRTRSNRRLLAKDRLEDRLLAGDDLGAWNVIESAMASGADPSEVHLELLVPVLRSIGERWAAGELTVGDEHRAVAVARRVIGRMSPRFYRRGRKRGTVVVGTPAGERHELPVAITADHLRAAGYDVVDFGADTPAEAFAQAACSQRPVAVLLALTGVGHEQEVAAVVEAVRATSCTPVLVGGAAVTDAAAARALGADGWSGADALSVVAAVEALTAG
jgi:excisionase family DNA binding protein